MARETFTLDGLSLNDGTNFSLEELRFTPARKRGEFIDNPDSDGSIPVEDEERYENSGFELRVRVVPQASMDAALAKLGELQDKLQAAKPGSTVSGTWQPADSTDTYTVYVLRGEAPDIPVVVEGADAGWFVKAPVIGVQLTCKPFLYGSETSVSATTSTEPLVTQRVPSVAGDVPAEGRLVVTDNATQDRWHVEWGEEQLPAQSEYADILIADSPSLYWKLDETSGTTATDSSGNSRNGTYQGGATLGADGPLHHKAVDLDGTDDYISSSYNPFVNGTVRTFEGWAWRDTDTDNDMLFAGDDAGGAVPRLYIASGANAKTVQWDAAVGAGDVDSWVGAWPGTGQWVHWVLIFDEPNDTVTLFINGVSQGALTHTDAYGAASGNFKVGAWAAGAADAFNGRMAHVAVYEKALTAAEITEHYRAGLLKLLLDSDELSTSGLAGSGNTRSGAYDPNAAGNSVIRATLTTGYVKVCGTGVLPHTGSFRVKARVYASGTGDYSVRLSWRAGDTPLSRNDPAAPLDDAWSEVDLGTVTIPEALAGSQKWEAFIEAKSETVGDTLDVDYIELIPTSKGYGKARRTLAFESPDSFSARDEFDQTAGALTGKTLPVGGTWAGAGDADDFSVETTGKTAQRTAVSDAAALSGARFAIAGTATFTAVTQQIDFKWSVGADAGNHLHLGLVARYTDTSNFLLARLRIDTPSSSSGDSATLELYKRVAGADTLLGSYDMGTLQDGGWWTMRLDVDAGGGAWVFLGQRGSLPSSPQITASDSVLATGGALASGKAAFNDHYLSSEAVTRNYDNFWVAVPTTDAVIFSGQSLEARHNDTIREDSTGVYYGRPPLYRGSRFYVPHAGTDSLVSRVAVKARRNDIDEMKDDNIADSLTVRTYWTPRHLIPR